MDTFNTIKRFKIYFFVTNIFLCTGPFIGCATTTSAHSKGVVRAATLPDLSGLAWVEDDLFIGVHDAKRNPAVELGEDKRLATMDGLKVESIAVRETKQGGQQVFVGTDDEHYGGIIRLLPIAP